MSIESRLQRLEDLEKIRKLITRFSKAADAKCDPVMLRPLFTDDATFDLRPYGCYEGADNIVASMHANVDVGFNWTLHYLISPEIELQEDSDVASCFYYLWEPAETQKADSERQAYWIGGWYDAKVRKQGDVWKFEHLKLTVKLMSAYKEGFSDMPKSLQEA